MTLSDVQFERLVRFLATPQLLSLDLSEPESWAVIQTMTSVTVDTDSQVVE